MNDLFKFLKYKIDPLDIYITPESRDQIWVYFDRKKYRIKIIPMNISNLQYLQFNISFLREELIYVFDLPKKIKSYNLLLQETCFVGDAVLYVKKLQISVAHIPELYSFFKILESFFIPNSLRFILDI